MFSLMDCICASLYFSHHYNIIKMELSPLSQLRQGNTIWRIRVYVARLWHHRGGYAV